jgi:hypothetical protein
LSSESTDGYPLLLLLLLLLIEEGSSSLIEEKKRVPGFIAFLWQVDLRRVETLPFFFSLPP